MAISSTINKVSLNIADVDRHYYQLHELTVAQHPSENDFRFMIRLIAFMANASEAKQILAQLGMNFSESVNIFTSQVVAQRGLPFSVSLSNKDTQVAMRDVRAGKNIEPISLEQLKREMTL